MCTGVEVVQTRWGAEEMQRICRGGAEVVQCHRGAEVQI